jgi:hypothetical protein
MGKRLGQIYQVDVGANQVRYFWEVGADGTQLGSALIVVFKTVYPRMDAPDLEAITADEVDFYCHTFVRIGVKLGHWSKVGFRPLNRNFAMPFRDTGDYGNPEIRVSRRWYCWEPNEPFRDVKWEPEELCKMEIGVVFPSDSVVNRIHTGVYGVVYPAYEEGGEPYA